MKSANALGHNLEYIRSITEHSGIFLKKVQWTLNSIFVPLMIIQ